MPINRENVLVEMQKDVPSFRINPEWLKDELTYPIFNDLARFVCSAALHSQWHDVTTSLNFLERALQDSESEIHDLVMECVDTLASCEAIASAKNHFGPKLKAVWKVVLNE